MNVSTGLTQKRFVVPQVVASHFHLREGDQVADFGVGSGYFLQVLSQMVGSSGRVYACDIQRDLIEKIGNLARSSGWSNVDPLWCDLEEVNGVKITNDALDVLVMVNTFFQLEDKETALHEALRTLRSGGKLFIIDWTESFGGLGPRPDQVVTAETTTALAESTGFVFERDFDAGDHHYGIAFRKP